MIDILVGDCRETLKTIPDSTVHCCVTSPPYWGLRSYLPAGHHDKHREIGSEPTPDAYVQTMVEVFREVRRVLHDSGTVWLNVGDSYTSQPNNNAYHHGEYDGSGLPNWDRQIKVRVPTPPKGRSAPGLKPKDLCLIPWRLAIALQADGWWVRSVICWAKKSCMPESVTDRPTNSWEPIFLLAKNAWYFYDAEAVKEPSADGTAKRYRYKFYGEGTKESVGNGRPGAAKNTPGMKQWTGTSNQRNVWHLGPEPYSEAHFATFPTEIPRRAILAGTSARGCCPKCFAPWVRVVESESVGRKRKNGMPIAPMPNQPEHDGGRAGSAITRTFGWEPGCECGEQPIPCTVLDPFGGSGTTGKVAIELARNVILCELSEQYAALIKLRTTTTQGMILA